MQIHIVKNKYDVESSTSGKTPVGSFRVIEKDGYEIVLISRNPDNSMDNIIGIATKPKNLWKQYDVYIFQEDVGLFRLSAFADTPELAAAWLLLSNRCERDLCLKDKIIRIR